jgi:hypothetical protein
MKILMMVPLSGLVFISINPSMSALMSFMTKLEIPRRYLLYHSLCYGDHSSNTLEKSRVEVILGEKVVIGR